MTVWKLRLEHFRSFADSLFDLESKTALIGNNGAGKSNVIEALRLLSVGKSFKTSRLDDAIMFEQPYFRLTETNSTAATREVSFFYGVPYPNQPTKERVLRVNGQDSSWSDYWGKRPSVLFIPDDIDIVIGAPQVRRRYLDSILWQTSAGFRQDHQEVTRVLRERSALLFMVKVNRASQQELHPWNELLLKLTEKIRAHRQEFTSFLLGQTREAPTVFTSGAEVMVEYQAGEIDFERMVREEIRLSQNLIGPHRDELEIRFNDQPARRFTSRGQARAIVMMLKLAEARFLEQRTKTTPLVLLDDMFSELDLPTSEALFNQLNPAYPIVATSITPNPLIKDWHAITLP